jgi:hypothetical protein
LAWKYPTSSNWTRQRNFLGESLRGLKASFRLLISVILSEKYTDQHDFMLGSLTFFSRLGIYAPELRKQQ